MKESTDREKMIRPFLNQKGQITEWPAKRAKQAAVLAHLAEHIEAGRDYTEKEINEIIAEQHTFGDFFLLRREMVDQGFLCRTNNGARYWKGEK